MPPTWCMIAPRTRMKPALAYGSVLCWALSLTDLITDWTNVPPIKAVRRPNVSAAAQRRPLSGVMIGAWKINKRNLFSFFDKTFFLLPAKALE